jgi:hypothetical protein
MKNYFLFIAMLFAIQVNAQHKKQTNFKNEQTVTLSKAALIDKIKVYFKILTFASKQSDKHKSLEDHKNVP